MTGGYPSTNLLFSLHRYCATAFTKIKNGYMLFYSHFPIQHFISIRLLPCSWLTTFRQSYLWIRLGSSSKPVFSFRYIACNDIWIFITTILTHPQTPHLWWELPLGKFKRLDLYIRKYVSALVYTFSPCVFDTRHIGSTVHLWTAFVSDVNISLTATLCRLHRAFDNEIV